MRKRLIRDKDTGNLKVKRDMISPIHETDGDIWINVNELTTLDKVAQEFYKNPNKWRIVAKANGLKSIVCTGKERIRVPLQDEFDYIRD